MPLEQIEWSLYEELQKENKELKARLLELETRLYDLTPGGSEFNGSPDKCVRWIARQLQTRVAVIRRYQKQAREDAAIIEAALDIYPDLRNAPVIRAALAAGEAE